ncbi:N-acetyltransferase [Pseudanabaena sp. FACHB-2040]|uniref:GNAT family N-acetyltransferase n=1 Tax=Pseudanabaena sp. FACHB-2040 TaxID=2692859 RepID=UPI00321F9A04
MEESRGLPIKIRPEQVSDYGAIAQLHTLAFGQSSEARLVEKIRHSVAYVSDLALVAEINCQIVGHILFSYGQLVGKDTVPVLVLAPLAVLPQHQRQGIGKRLVQQGLRAARARGNSLVTVLGEPAYYSQFGFEPAVRYGIESPFPVPEAAFMVKLVGQNSDLLHGKLQYAPAFDDVIQEATHAEA